MAHDSEVDKLATDNNVLNTISFKYCEIFA